MTAIKNCHAHLSYIERLQHRAKIIQSIRAFFDNQGFIEVDTPVAIFAPAPELEIEAIPVTIKVNDVNEQRYLQTSPELAMKQILAAGGENIYQIASVFRDNDHSPQHRPEFRMLEWYRKNTGWEQLLMDCEQLLATILLSIMGNSQQQQDRTQLIYQDNIINFSAPFSRITVDEAFIKYAGFSILCCQETSLLATKARRLELVPAHDDTWTDLFFRIFLNCVEPNIIASGQPIFVTDYPAQLCSLARISPSSPLVSERFELYIGGMELANGFGELTDSTLQHKRFTKERALRKQAGKRDYPLDEQFIKCLDQIPSAAGIALGIDRLLMLLLDCKDIEQTCTLS